MENPTYRVRGGGRLRVPYHEEQRCTLVAIKMSEYIFRVCCPNCTQRGSSYVQHVQDEFAEFIQCKFRNIPQISVLEMADMITSAILPPYIRHHRCPPSDRLVETSTVNAVIMEMLQDGMVVSFEEDMESFEDEDMEGFFEDEEDAPLMTIPVSESWLKLELINKAIEEDDLGGWNAADHECVICFESIPKRIDSLTLPCSHVFHQDCIVQWLKTSHLCPLCRHAMPIDD